ncbi:MAG: hypothetical protein ACOWWR_03280 [Eubacteriales bacterium]
MLIDSKKIVAVSLAGILICFSVSTTRAQAQSQTISSQKEEVVYSDLDGNGDITGTYLVNIFHSSEITDYGDYDKIRNMNTSDEINYENGMIRIHTEADKLYYEGIIENAELPWNIEITYKMDGTEYSAEKIAGMSGKLSIIINITENKNAKKGFFDNYALQAIFKLDTGICSNIISDGATTANVGNVKQLTYTIMPGTEKDIVVKADVVDFEMENIALNGVRLNLGIDTDTLDISELNEQIVTLQDAVATLDNGANHLNGGTSSLTGSATKLNDGIQRMNEALDTLNAKSSALTGGSSEVKSALSTIQTSLSNVNISTDELDKLTDSSTLIKEGIDSLVGGLQTIDGSIDRYYSSLSNTGITDSSVLVTKHNDAIVALGITNTQRKLYSAYTEGGISSVIAKLGELVSGGDTESTELYTKYESAGNDATIINAYITQAGTLLSVETLLKADIAYIKGSEQLISGIDGTLDSKKGDLMSGALSLQESYRTFDESIQSLVSSLGTLAANMSTLKSGIDQLDANYDSLDHGIMDYTTSVNSIKGGYAQICQGALDLVKGTNDLYDGTKELVEGTGTFSDETSELQSDVDDKIDSMVEDFTKNDYEIVSFVSNKNTNVSSVQFVMKVAAIEKIEAVSNTETQEESLDIWQKFLKLFGW